MKNWKYIEGAKTGNDTPWEYAHRKPKVINEDLKSYSEVLEKAKRELEKVKEKEKMADSIKSKEEWASARREIEDKIKYYQSHIGNEDKTGAEEFFKQLSDDVKEREEKDDADIEKVGNALGKDIYQHKLDPNQYMVVDWDKDTVTIIVNGVVRDVIKNTDKVAYAVDHVYKRVNSMNKVGNKVGNATPNYRYKDFLITNPDGHEYIVFLKDGRTVGYRGTTSKAQAEDWCDWHDPKTGKAIGNKTGNSTVSEYNAEIQRLTKKAEQLRRMGQGRQAMGVEKQIEKLGKELSEIGNSAQDDKFAYVMREFDEGKLKTPDGKVVTDPAQAKAIAYSESKKTENGLARARNAIKKS